jgi:hypothetical protein
LVSFRQKNPETKIRVQAGYLKGDGRKQWQRRKVEEGKEM